MHKRPSRESIDESERKKLLLLHTAAQLGPLGHGNALDELNGTFQNQSLWTHRRLYHMAKFEDPLGWELWVTIFNVLYLHKVGVDFWWTSDSMFGSLRHREKNPGLYSCFSNQLNKATPNTDRLSWGILVLLSWVEHTTFLVLKPLSEAGVQGGCVTEGLAYLFC